MSNFRKTYGYDYYERLPATARPGETALCDGELWRCSQYSKRMPDSIKWRKVIKRKKVNK